MRTIKRIVVAFLSVVAALVLYFFASWDPSFSMYSAIYECSEVLTKAPNTSGPFKLFIKIAQERWWVFLHPTAWCAALGKHRWDRSDYS